MARIPIAVVAFPALVALHALAGLPAPAPAAAVVVYGNTITLAGSERAVTSFTVVLRIGGAGVAQFDMRVRFYLNDGPADRPGTLIWESPLTHRVIDSGAPIAYTLPVPGVIVPDRFTWTVQILNRQGNAAVMGPSEFHPPAVGDAPFGYWRRTGGPEIWELAGPQEPPFGARVLAEAAPAAVEDRDAAPRARPLALTVAPNPVAVRATLRVTGATRPEPIAIYDPAGRLVATLEAGPGGCAWAPPPGAPAGVYVARATRRGLVAKLVVLR